MGLVQPVEVRALEGYRIWLRYDDGVEGEVDLSHMLDSELLGITSLTQQNLKQMTLQTNQFSDKNSVEIAKSPRNHKP